MLGAPFALPSSDFRIEDSGGHEGNLSGRHGLRIFGSVCGMRILHLSDTHLTLATGFDGDSVDTRESLRRILHDCRGLPGLDVVVVTGDVADDSSREAYADALELVGGFAGERRIPAVFSTGNHDERA